MSRQILTQACQQKPTAHSNSLLQRKCACGNHTIRGGECRECSKINRSGLQTKLKVNEPGDICEQEADRIADQVLATPAHPGVSGAPSRIQRLAGQTAGQMAAAPDSVDQALASPGMRLEPALRQDMEQRFGYDFSHVRVHSGAAAEQSAWDVNAHAYTVGHDMVFGPGRFKPETTDGRRLLAHELTHVVQQAGERRPAIQRDATGHDRLPTPRELVAMYKSEVTFFKHFDGIVRHLVTVLVVQPSPFAYIAEVFQAIASEYPSYEDDIGALFVSRMSDKWLDRFASEYEGRDALTKMYHAIITGDVTEFEREQANRVLLAKTKQIDPAKFVKMATGRGDRLRTPIFPVRFMRVTPGQDYAPPEVTVLPNGRLRVKYHVGMKSMSTFKNEIPTLGNVFGAGMELSVNEIVGIKDYERGGGVLYLPALALIDYANQATESTSGKIIEVSLFAATMGIGGGAAVGGKALAGEATAVARWGTRIAKGLSALDRVANFVGIAAFFINENRVWIIDKFGNAGRRLVQIADVANTAAAIYGLSRLGQGGYQIVKEMRAASKQARAMGKQLSEAQSKALTRIDDETDVMLRELDEAEAAKSVGAPKAGKRAEAPKAAKEPAGPGRVEEPAPGKKAQPGAKATGKVDELEDAAKRVGVSRQRLESEVEDLRGQTVDPDNVHHPRNKRHDAEMDTQGHTYTRNKKERTWCRKSYETCELNFSQKLDPPVDEALAKKQRKFDELEQRRAAREAAPPRQPAPKREAAEAADPKAAKKEVRAKQKAARASTQRALQKQIDNAKEQELWLRVQIGKAEGRFKLRRDPAKKAAAEAEKKDLANQLNKQIEARQALQKQLDDLAVTPYDRARAFSYSDAAANDVVARARKPVDLPGGEKKVTVVDEMSGKPVKEPSIDHVVPVDDIVHMDGWTNLQLHQQREILSWTDNLRMMERRLNSAKGGKSWSKWGFGKEKYGVEVWDKMVKEENRLRKALQDRIYQMLGKAA